MGSRLVKQLIAYAIDVPLKPNEYRLMTYMALTALDDDTPPRYFDSREASALALGRRVRDEVHPDHPDHAEIQLERNAAFSAVKEAVSGLTGIGAIRRLKSGRAGRRAEFAVVIDVQMSINTEEYRRRRKGDGLRPRGRDSLPLKGRKSIPLRGRESLPAGV
ncbi:hypothetical protein [Microbacterium plantarum]|uniref:Uncharacterized protein n=1 Tax=Microbacterium plantarum TaxID=1816425 RepID=A0ABV5EUC9_9MICO